MRRTRVHVVQMRMADLLEGDVVNKNPDDPRGWIVVQETQELPNNGLLVVATREKDSINGNPNDIVGVQIPQAIEIPDAA
ncbi:MAG: hypothetical protein ACR2P0_08595 [Acidimicrobiales bacterium]